ncbi:MAG: hypothetical protein JWN70_6253 [Planctomycetaceae bacterium]|nr:hypothetical protein [Planctomycetaceae bacterium]
MGALLEGRTIDDAWLSTLRLVSEQPNRQLFHVMTTVSEPQILGDQLLREQIDKTLTPEPGKKKNLQSAETIANTIFPRGLYPDPKVTYIPGDDANNEQLAVAAETLYERYRLIFPHMKKLHAENKKGSYFQRMISWGDKKTLRGYNQLAKRIDQLQAKRATVTRFNASDLQLTEPGEPEGLPVEIQSAGDNRMRSFPCLVHVDIGVLGNKLNLMATYRHQMLISKGYGNFLGLARLQAFLAQQSGYAIGELAMQATVADAESTLFNKADIKLLLGASDRAELF